MKPKQPHGPPMTLGNMRELGVSRLYERARAKADEAERDRLERALEIGLEDTFPASDPVAVVQPSRQRGWAAWQKQLLEQPPSRASRASSGNKKSPAAARATERGYATTGCIRRYAIAFDSPSVQLGNSENLT
jgi:hypothetical protein